MVKQIQVDAELTQAWVKYYDNNFSWDDCQTHGGDDYVPYKKECKRIYKWVKETHDRSMADKMVEWAREAYERTYYNRGKSNAQLMAMLPPQIDKKAIAGDEVLNWKTTIKIPELSLEHIAELLWQYRNTKSKTPEKVEPKKRPYMDELISRGLMKPDGDSFRVASAGRRMVKGILRATKTRRYEVRTE